MGQVSAYIDFNNFEHQMGAIIDKTVNTRQKLTRTERSGVNSDEKAAARCQKHALASVSGIFFILMNKNEPDHFV
jgi:hypothetical protein